jgi:hypothetical protein
MSLLRNVKGIYCDLVGLIRYVELNIPIKLVVHSLIAKEDTSIEIFNFCFVSQSTVVLFFLNSQFTVFNPYLFLVFCSSSIFDYWFSILSCTLHCIFTWVTLIALSPHPSGLTFKGTTFKDNIFHILGHLIGLPKFHYCYK